MNVVEDIGVIEGEGGTTLLETKVGHKRYDLKNLPQYISAVDAVRLHTESREIGRRVQGLGEVEEIGAGEYKPRESFHTFDDVIAQRVLEVAEA